MTLNVSWMWMARVAKVLALLLFLMPWMVVSCNGNPLIEATGLQLITGNPTVADIPMTEAGGDESAVDRAWWVIAAAVLIIAGLVASFVIQQASTAGRVVLASSVIALVLLGGGMAHGINKMNANIEDSMKEDGETDEMARSMAAMLANAIKVEVKPGFWLTLVMLGVAGAGGFMAQSSRARPAAVSETTAASDGV